MGVNVDHGGQGARIVVVPRYAASDPRTKALYGRLRTISGDLGNAMQSDAAVGGPAAMIADYDAVAGSRLPIIVIVLTIVTALLLGVLLRSIAVPANFRAKARFSPDITASRPGSSRQAAITRANDSGLPSPTR